MLLIWTAETHQHFMLTSDDISVNMWLSAGTFLLIIIIIIRRTWWVSPAATTLASVWALCRSSARSSALSNHQRVWTERESDFFTVYSVLYIFFTVYLWYFFTVYLCSAGQTRCEMLPPACRTPVHHGQWQQPGSLCPKLLGRRAASGRNPARTHLKHIWC